VVLETDNSGATQARYVLGADELLSQTRGDITSYYLADGQGSVRLLTNSSGGITDSYTYDAFGNLQSSSGSTVNPYRYTGQQFDSLTGLYSLRARYYDSASGRFTSRDTAGIDFSNPVELNRYSYAQDNPVNLVDPSGHDPVDEEAGILSGVISAFQKLSPFWKFVTVVVVTFIAALLTTAGIITVIDLLTGSGPGVGLLPAPTPVLQIPPVTTNNDDQRGVAVVFREVAGKGGKTVLTNPLPKPGEFKRGAKDLDGLSTFTYPNLPGVKPYAVGFLIVYQPPLVFHEYGLVFATPGCVGQYTPEHGAGHWSLNCPGGTGPVLSEYAKKSCSAVVILDPVWKGQQTRQLDCSKV
jgi:RHS repeat-associated protein